MPEAYIGEIRSVAFNYAPEGWMLCEGQLLNKSDYQALYTVIGNIYGGDGNKTFALPNLNNRVIVGASKIKPNGKTGGQEAIGLTLSQLPAHTHVARVTESLSVFNGRGDTGDATRSFSLATITNTNALMMSSQAGTNSVNISNISVNTDVTGSGQPFSIMQPYLSLTYIIAVQGLFPIRP